MRNCACVHSVMTVAAKNSDTSSFHQPLLPEGGPQSLHPQSPQYVVVLPPDLPYYHRRGLFRNSCRWPQICFPAIVLFLIAAGYVFWPSDPDLSIVRLRLDRLHFRTRPQFSLDITLDLTIKAWNKDFYSIDYDSLLVAVGYRGERLGFMTSEGGRIRARGSSYVNATLLLDGAEVLNDVIFLIEDLAKGSIAFDTVSEIRGKLGLFFFALPLKTKISCGVIVNTLNQTIVEQNCYPQV